jgi:hypothetical protein
MGLLEMRKPACTEKTLTEKEAWKECFILQETYPKFYWYYDFCPACQGFHVFMEKDPADE